jgi:hypothetical protein
MTISNAIQINSLYHDSEGPQLSREEVQIEEMIELSIGGKTG